MSAQNLALGISGEKRLHCNCIGIANQTGKEGKLHKKALDFFLIVPLLLCQETDGVCLCTPATAFIWHKPPALNGMASLTSHDDVESRAPISGKDSKTRRFIQCQDNPLCTLMARHSPRAGFLMFTFRHTNKTVFHQGTWHGTRNTDWPSAFSPRPCLWSPRGSRPCGRAPAWRWGLALACYCLLPPGQHQHAAFFDYYFIKM